MDETASALHYRQRAAEARTIAETLADDGARKLMTRLADKWEGMAERAERRAVRSPPGGPFRPYSV
jgi:hypothetical protein